MTINQLRNLDERLTDFVTTKLRTKKASGEKAIVDYIIDQIYVFKWKTKLLELLQSKKLNQSNIISNLKRIKTHTKLELIYNTLQHKKVFNTEHVEHVINNSKKMDFATINNLPINVEINTLRKHAYNLQTHLKIFINDLKLSNLEFYASSYERIKYHVPRILSTMDEYNNEKYTNNQKINYFKDVIDRNIGLCHVMNHIKNNSFRQLKQYLDGILGQAEYIATNYVIEKK